MTRPDARLLVRAWWPGLVVAAAGVFGYLTMLDAVREQDDIWRLDEPLLEWFAAHRVGWITDLMVLVSWIFGPVVLPILVAAGGAIWGWRTRRWFTVAIVVGAEAFAGLLSLVLKYSVGRPRPPEQYWQEPGGTHTASFPSGHTLCTATLVLVTGYMAWRIETSLRVFVWWLTASALITGTVAISRLYLGYHFLTDVIAGAFAAFFVLGLVMGIVRTHDLRRARSDGLDPT